jgi:hypothetical protein
VLPQPLELRLCKIDIKQKMLSFAHDHPLTEIEHRVLQQEAQQGGLAVHQIGGQVTLLKATDACCDLWGRIMKHTRNMQGTVAEKYRSLVQLVEQGQEIPGSPATAAENRNIWWRYEPVVDMQWSDWRNSMCCQYAVHTIITQLHQRKLWGPGLPSDVLLSKCRAAGMAMKSRLPATWADPEHSWTLVSPSGVHWTNLAQLLRNLAWSSEAKLAAFISSIVEGGAPSGGGDAGMVDFCLFMSAIRDAADVS